MTLASFWSSGVGVLVFGILFIVVGMAVLFAAKRTPDFDEPGVLTASGSVLVLVGLPLWLFFAGSTWGHVGFAMAFWGYILLLAFAVWALSDLQRSPRRQISVWSSVLWLLGVPLFLVFAGIPFYRDQRR